MWNNIWGIYRSDLKKLIRNWVALVIAAGLVLLPSLYAWINIWACWDPYGNTSGVKVGIVNEDEGGTLNDIQVQIGDEVVKSLKENHALGWTFYENRDAGVKGAENGDVYATIIIPGDFSSKMCTVLDEIPVKPTLDYYVNEKINAIAPKMTDKGVSTVQQQISSTFIKTAVSEVFSVFNEVGIQVSDHLPMIEKYKGVLLALNDQFPGMDQRLDNLLAKAENGIVSIDPSSEDVQFIESALGDAIAFNQGFSADLQDLQKGITTAEQDVRENLVMAQDLFRSISVSAGNLEQAIRDNKPAAVNQIDDLIFDAQRLSGRVQDVTDRLYSANIGVSQEILNLSSSLQSDLTTFESHLKELKQNLGNLKEVTRLCNLLRKENREMITKLEDLRTSVNTLCSQLDSALSSAQMAVDKIGEAIDALGRHDGGAAAKVQEGLQAVSAAQAALSGNSSLYSGALSNLADSKTALERISGLLPGAGGDWSIIDQALEPLKNLSHTLSLALDSARSRVAQVRSDVSQTVDSFQDILWQTNRILSDLSDLTAGTSSNAQTDIDNLLAKIGRMKGYLSDNEQKITQRQSEISEDVAALNHDLLEKTNELESKLLQVKNRVDSNDSAEELLGQVSSLSSNLSGLMGKMAYRMDIGMLPKMEQYLLTGSEFADGLNTALTDMQGDIDAVQNLVGHMKNRGYVTVEEVKEIKGRLPNLSENLTKLAAIVKQIDEKAGVDKIVELLSRSPESEGDFFSSPVDVHTNALFPIKNYGAGMTPFYSTLAMWVGALLLSALLSTKSKNAPLGYTPIQEFFGKYLLFGTLAFLQGVIIILGDLMILKVSVVHPILLVFLGGFYSLVFSMIVYSLVSLFGNVGKAIGVVFLVFQIAGTGGTFPIQVTPPFFQALYNLLPFTYAISGMREAVGGIVYSVLLKDLAVLLLYGVVFTLLGSVLKKPINQLFGRFGKKLKESNVFEH